MSMLYAHLLAYKGPGSIEALQPMEDISAMNNASAINKLTFSSSGFSLKDRVSTELLEKSIMAASFGYVITECGHKTNPIVLVNQAFQELTGYKAKEVLGKNCRFLLGKDNKQESLDQIRDAIESGCQCTAVVRNYRKDGALFFNELTVLPVNDQTGQMTHCVWMLRDVTPQIEEKERMTALIADKEDRFSAYMENANEALWRIDFDPPISLEGPEAQQVHGVFENGVFVEANDVAARIYGYTNGKEVRGRPLIEFMDESDLNNVERVTELVRNKFCMRNMIAHEKSSDEESKVTLNNISPHIRKGEVIHIWGASLDVSDLFKTQESLNRSKEELVVQKKALEEKNIALKELISQIGLEKKDFKDRVMANIEQVVLPSLEKIRLNKGKKVYIEQHHKALQNLASTFGLRVAGLKIRLSPREIEVCNLVKNGLTNKEIARMLNIALHTVEKHRRMARKKLDLTNKGINLHNFLNSH